MTNSQASAASRRWKRRGWLVVLDVNVPTTKSISAPRGVRPSDIYIVAPVELVRAGRNVILNLAIAEDSADESRDERRARLQSYLENHFSNNRSLT